MWSSLTWVRRRWGGAGGPRGRRSGGGGLALPVRILVAVEEPVDVGLRDGQRLAQLAADVHGACHLLAEDGRLDGSLGAGTDGERAVVLHQHRLRAVAPQRRDDALPDGVVTDQGERAERDLAT